MISLFLLTDDNSFMGMIPEEIVNLKEMQLLNFCKWDCMFFLSILFGLLSLVAVTNSSLVSCQYLKTIIVSMELSRQM